MTGQPDSLHFVPEVLAIKPKEVVQFSVQAQPKRRFPVEFALLGEFEDASLDGSRAMSDESGVAQGTLTGPGLATTFTLLATSGPGVIAQAGVSVSTAGFTSLAVLPSYAGKRPTKNWIASVRAGIKCTDIPGAPPEDGDLMSPPSLKPTINNVPVGPRLAITLRAGHYIGGCAESDGLLAGTPQTIKVNVKDVPLKTEETKLELALKLGKPKSGSFQELFKKHNQRRTCSRDQQASRRAERLA